MLACLNELHLAAMHQDNRIDLLLRELWLAAFDVMRVVSGDELFIFPEGGGYRCRCYLRLVSNQGKGSGSMHKGRWVGQKGEGSVAKFE